MVNAANIQKIPETTKRFREYFRIEPIYSPMD